MIVGAGQAGLASAYAARRAGLEPVVLEVSAEPTGSWPRYYESLALFSPARYSSLPERPLPGDPERYPTGAELGSYDHRGEPSSRSHDHRDARPLWPPPPRRRRGGRGAPGSVPRMCRRGEGVGKFGEVFGPFERLRPVLSGSHRLAKRAAEVRRLQEFQRSQRRGWDSNPRIRWTRISGFQDRRIRPLCHPSGRLSVAAYCAFAPSPIGQATPVPPSPQ